MYSPMHNTGGVRGFYAGVQTGKAYPELLLALHKAQLQRLLSHLHTKRHILQDIKLGEQSARIFTHIAHQQASRGESVVLQAEAVSQPHQLVSAWKVQMDAPVLGMHTESSRGLHPCMLNTPLTAVTGRMSAELSHSALQHHAGSSLALPGSWTTRTNFSQAPSSNVFTVYSGICNTKTLSVPPSRMKLEE